MKELSLTLPGPTMRRCGPSLKFCVDGEKGKEGADQAMSSSVEPARAAEGMFAVGSPFFRVFPSRDCLALSVLPERPLLAV